MSGWYKDDDSVSMKNTHIFENAPNTPQDKTQDSRDSKRKFGATGAIKLKNDEIPRYDSHCYENADPIKEDSWTTNDLSKVTPTQSQNHKLSNLNIGPFVTNRILGKNDSLYNVIFIIIITL